MAAIALQVTFTEAEVLKILHALLHNKCPGGPAKLADKGVIQVTLGVPEEALLREVKATAEERLAKLRPTTGTVRPKLVYTDGVLKGAVVEFDCK